MAQKTQSAVEMHVKVIRGQLLRQNFATCTSGDGKEMQGGIRDFPSMAETKFLKVATLALVARLRISQLCLNVWQMESGTRARWHSVVRKFWPTIRGVISYMSHSYEQIPTFCPCVSPHDDFAPFVAFLRSLSFSLFLFFV